MEMTKRACEKCRFRSCGEKLSGETWKECIFDECPQEGLVILPAAAIRLGRELQGAEKASAQQVQKTTTVRLK